MSLLYILLGAFAGALSGLIGIGGGVIIVPSLIFLFGFSQQEAQGTTLGLLVPPIGILAAWTYYQQGYVNFKVAALICLGFVLGGLLGAKLAINLPSNILEKIFGILLLLIALKMIFSNPSGSSRL
ncbi:TSUP family transporter [Pleurocapsa sp. FMAR1]|uniref:TSUP family transporter n=1 Tax=Pleurocapsa sp. FMAR1 TaxID=3040204 RepID=UPI0029C93C06|nr:TSUP family transporter [Pleurocapsa sp. FMAR1]